MLIGTRNKYNEALISETESQIKILKDRFLLFARPKVLSGYVKATRDCNWTSGGQNITTWSGIRNYIRTAEWNEGFARDIYYLQYGRFTECVTLIDWDIKLDDQFRNKNNVEYSETENLKCRVCFTILAVSIKTDYNQRLRKLCNSIHKIRVKRRGESTDNKRTTTTYSFHPKYVRVSKNGIMSGGIGVNDRKDTDDMKHQFEKLK